jgi:hypothetical protein
MLAGTKPGGWPDMTDTPPCSAVKLAAGCWTETPDTLAETAAAKAAALCLANSVCARICAKVRGAACALGDAEVDAGRAFLGGEGP